MFASEAILHDAKKRDPTLPDPSKARFGEPFKFLPVCFVFFVIFSLWFIYTFTHCLPSMADQDTYRYGMSCTVVFNILFAFVIVCYFRSMLQHPGTIPEVSNEEQGEVIWEYGRQSSDGRTSPHSSLQEPTGPYDKTAVGKERKRLGDRRNCKWCNKYKPDRCHHCRVCRMCILKMDHHCPWIYNCVGFKNFKYFFLLVLYSATVSNMIFWTMLTTTSQVCGDVASSFTLMFLVLFGQTLAGLMAFLLTAFFSFHIYLMVRAMTTIEFCEKSRRPNFDTDIYSFGLLANVQAVLGESPLLWLLPICPPTGDGTFFDSADPMVFSSPRSPHSSGSASKHGPVANYGAATSPTQLTRDSAGTGEQPCNYDGF